MTEILAQKTRSSLQDAREAYSAAIAQRSASQREVNELLQRKHAWSPSDLERFTALYRSDHVNEQAESAAQENLADIERKAEDAADQLSKSILARYHEEQIWSDKIRRMSTWGTWGLMGVNVLLFLIFQIGVEPWRRKRLVKGFEEKVMEALERETPAIKESGPVEKSIDDAALEDLIVADSVAKDTDAEGLASDLPKPNSTGDDVLPAVDGPRSTSVNPSSSKWTFDTLQTNVRDIFDERQIKIRRVDLTNARLEAAAAGAALTVLMGFLFRSR